jgi:alanyl-tRNA synthetase
MAKLKRAFNSQKCIRAGGKHNGVLSNFQQKPWRQLMRWQIWTTSERTHIITPSSRCWETGRLATTSRFVSCQFHATIHSPRPYFIKKEAISYSWELLTAVYGLPKDRLYVTYFEGDPKNGLEPDLEAKQFWIDQGVLEDHILPGNAKDNFWGVLLCILFDLFLLMRVL